MKFTRINCFDFVRWNVGGKMTEPKHKIWKTVATFNDYTAAAAMKESLVDKHTLVKIKRGYPDIFRIKVWDPTPEKEKKPSVKKNNLKKGQNQRRQNKNVKNNKKIRSGQQG